MDTIIDNRINLEDFQKTEIKVGQILAVEKVPETDKLLKLKVDFAESEPRQIISGIAKYFPDFSVLINKKCMFVTNLQKREIKGLESNGMLLAISTSDNKFSLLEPDQEIPNGSLVK